MEIKLINKEIPIWIEDEPLTDRSQIGIEAVIPDSREDAASVLWAQGGLLLKGKNPSAHSLTVSEELKVSVLYQTENGSLDTLSLKKEFEINVEMDIPDPEALPQIFSRVVSLEAKLLNPRKLSVSADVQTVLQPFSRDKLSLDTLLPEKTDNFMHLFREQKQVLVLKLLQEKTFTIREQLQTKPGLPLPRSIAGENLSLINLETEILGTRTIVKGEAELRIWGLDETGFPVFSCYRMPFSQLVDTGVENADIILAQAVPCSVYLDWIDGAGGERSIEAEVHGVLQLRCYAKEQLSLVGDAYHTRMPSTIVCENRTLISALKRKTALLRGEESFPLPEEVDEILCSEAKLGLLESDREHVSLPLTANLLYRSKAGVIGSVRRSIRLQGEALDTDARLSSVRLCSCEALLENGKLKLHGEAELVVDHCCSEQLEAVCEVELQENEAWDPTDTPALSLVFPHGESLWELAKEYRSSVEIIEKCNPDRGELLLIPAE